VGSFEAAYTSAWHHPFIAWAGGTAVFLWFVQRRDIHPLYLFLLVEILRPRGPLARKGRIPRGRRRGSPGLGASPINRASSATHVPGSVPLSIVEYRPEEQIRQYIVNPLRFRYGTMPAHPDLTKADLDGLIAYFQLMKTQKHDPKPTSP
jgi:hypothetical protein